MRIALRAMGVTVLAVPALCLPCAAQQKAVPAAPVAVAQQPKIPTDRTAQVVSETYLGMLVCADCGEVEELDAASCLSALGEATAAVGFSVRAQNLVLTGTCKQCQS